MDAQSHGALAGAGATSPRPPHDVGDVGFGCAQSCWRAVLDVMVLGLDEQHQCIPLMVGEAPRVIRLDAGMLLTIDRCVAMFATNDGEPGEFKSEYPILILHVLIRLARDDTPSSKADVDTVQSSEMRQLEDALERLLSIDGAESPHPVKLSSSTPSPI